MRDNKKIYLDEVESACEFLGEPSRAGQAANDKKSNLKFFAVRVPLLRKIEKKGFSFSHYPPDRLLEVWDFVYMNSDFYEPMSLALFTGLNGQFDNSSRLLTTCLSWKSRVENWGHCDLLGNLIAKQARFNWPAVEPVVNDWSVQTSIMSRRLSLVSLVDYVGANSTYLEFNKIVHLLDQQLDSKEPYISNAVGWVLREYLKSNQSDVASNYVGGNWNRLNYRAKSKLTKSQRERYENE